MKSTNIVSRAQDFASRAHEKMVGETVSGFIRPQTIHLQEVADLVWASGGSDEEIAAAWLHDIVEDTPTTFKDIEDNFGKTVALLVKELTDLPEFKDLPLTERKQRQSERIKNESVSARKIKLADQTSNIRMLAYDPIRSFSDPENCKKYIIGAKLIAEKCFDINPMLEKLFIAAYEKGAKRYNI